MSEHIDTEMVSAIPEHQGSKGANARYLVPPKVSSPGPIEPEHLGSQGPTAVVVETECRGRVNSDVAERLMDKSSSTDQSSLDPEQPDKPLIVENYVIKNRRTDSGRRYEQTSATGERGRVRRERIFCLIGLFTLLAGLILMAAALLLLTDAQCAFKRSEPPSKNSLQRTMLAEQVHGDGLYDVTSQVSSGVHTVPSSTLRTTATTTTVHTLPSFDHLVNLAKNKEAFQSSTYRSSQGVLYPAAAAVDGLSQNMVHSGSCSQTNPEESPVWWLDLGRLFLVKHIRITQPVDCCDGWLKNFEIRVGQEKNLADNMLCFHHKHVALASIVDVDCSTVLYGRYVSIQMLQDPQKPTLTQLTLCEVAVYKG